ncbi:hypothetical protein LVY72_22580 [Arthrobacter sp. I2-34]|uniref:Uncharacterized protein n=1 Tax=Arthrobacter hankyongi TaxID=2904801 RepID=A0ABS9LDE1_9MICC|nr:hypothetical protein [Arthrobacter hankyongi]MCG2624680.1 hypothetical protein [Arthrobacter hankyongi]
MNEELFFVRYLRNREGWRAIARAAFDEELPEAEDLRINLDEFVTRTAYKLSGFNASSVKNGGYLTYLLYTFVRTHMVVSELVQCGDLLEAATLQRKQMETIARLHEVAKTESVEELLRRTPNVKHLKSNLRTLYGLYSEVAHSASDSYFYLLSRGENSPFLSLFPKHSHNSYISLTHVALGVTELYFWMRENAEELGLPYDSEYAEAWASHIFPVIVALNKFIGEDQERFVGGK